MGIQKCTLQLYKDFFKRGLFSEINSVMELGSQELQVNKNDILSLLESIGKKCGSCKTTCNKIMPDLSIKQSTKIIYDWLGVKDYECIDADGMFNAKVFDLNKTYDSKKKFDLVTNFGMSEHIFNQLAFFKTLHNLTKEGGYMFHRVPFQGFLNQSLYLYEPNFFKYLAEDNNYEIEGMWLGVNYEFIVPYSEDNVKKYYRETPLKQYLKGLTSLSIYCLLKKTKDGDFKMPYQAEYKKISKLK